MLLSFLLWRGRWRLFLGLEWDSALSFDGGVDDDKDDGSVTSIRVPINLRSDSTLARGSSSACSLSLAGKGLGGR